MPKELFEVSDMNDWMTVIYTTDMESAHFVLECKKKGKICVSAVDARSAFYMATGICAQNHCKVAVCVDGGNASRSAFSGMTEAFYRKLPVALITIGRKLNYTKELNDVIVNHHIANSNAEVMKLMDNDFPIHIELIEETIKQKQIKCYELQQILSSELEKDDYLYISQGIERENCLYSGKVVYGGMLGCYDGALANILGASLARLHKKYIGLISEEELVHDLNTLGNININDLFSLVVVGKKKNSTLADYASALQFEVKVAKEDQITENEIKSVCQSNKKTILMVYKE